MKNDKFRILYSTISILVTVIFFIFLVFMKNNGWLPILFSKDLVEVYYTVALVTICALAYFFDSTRKPYNMDLSFYFFPLYMMIFLSVVNLASNRSSINYLIIVLSLFVLILINHFVIKKFLLKKLLIKQKVYQTYLLLYYVIFLTLVMIITFYML